MEREKHCSGTWLPTPCGGVVGLVVEPEPLRFSSSHAMWHSVCLICTILAEMAAVVRQTDGVSCSTYRARYGFVEGRRLLGISSWWRGERLDP